MLKLKPVHYNFPSYTSHSQKSIEKRKSGYETRALKEENKIRKSSEHIITVFSFSLLKTTNFKRKPRSIQAFHKAPTWDGKFIKNKEQKSSYLFPSLPPTCLFFRHIENPYYSSFYWRQHLPL